MKKPYISLHQILVLVLFLSFVIIYSCRKESVPKTVVTNSNSDKSTKLITEAKAYLDSALKTNSTTIKLSSTESNSTATAFNGHLFWDKAKSSFNKNFEVVEVPAVLEYKQVNFYNLVKDTSTINTKKAVTESAFVRVLIFKDSIDNIYDKRIITYIPDKKYLDQNPEFADKNWIGNIDKNYSGYIEYRTWENVPYKVFRFDSGTISFVFNVSQQVNNLKVQTLKTNLYQCNTAVVDNYIMVCIGSNCSVTYTGSTVTTTCFDTGGGNGSPPPCDCAPPGGYGGGGNGTVATTLSDADIANSTPIANDNDPIDPATFIKCFTDGKTASQYKLTIYVDQPTPGSNDKISFLTNSGQLFRSPAGRLYSVGHTFVGFQKVNTDGSSVTQVMGFYPGGNAIRSHGVIKDDGGHGYAVSYTTTVNANEFSAAMQLVVDNGNLAYYQLSTATGINEYNCTDAAIHWMWQANVNIPSGTSTSNFDRSPGQYGQDLRSITGSNTTPGHAPISHGSCN